MNWKSGRGDRPSIIYGRRSSGIPKYPHLAGARGDNWARYPKNPTMVTRRIRRLDACYRWYRKKREVVPMEMVLWFKTNKSTDSFSKKNGGFIHSGHVGTIIIANQVFCISDDSTFNVPWGHKLEKKYFETLDLTDLLCLDYLLVY
jgi:hypothetical protein